MFITTPSSGDEFWWFLWMTRYLPWTLSSHTEESIKIHFQNWEQLWTILRIHRNPLQELKFYEQMNEPNIICSFINHFIWMNERTNEWKFEISVFISNSVLSLTYRIDSAFCMSPLFTLKAFETIVLKSFNEKSWPNWPNHHTKKTVS